MSVLSKGLITAIVFSVVFGSLIGFGISYAMLQPSINNLQTSNTQLQSNLTAVQNNLAHDETEINQLLSNLTTLQNEVDDLSSSVNNAEAKLNETEEEILAFYQVFYETEGIVLAKITFTVSEEGLAWNVTGINMKSPNEFISPVNIYNPNYGVITIFNPTDSDIMVTLSSTNSPALTVTLSETTLLIPANGDASFTADITVEPSIAPGLYQIEVAF